MTRLIATFLVLLLASPALSQSALSQSISLSLKEWRTISHRIEQSIVRIKDPDGGTCTGFSINRSKHYVLTAAHCDDRRGVTVDSELAETVYKSPELDLMVLRSSGMFKRALEPSVRSIDRGLPVAALGYGWNFPQPMLRTGAVMNGNAFVILRFAGGVTGFFQLSIFKVEVHFGMSGGPFFDQDGRVASIVQMGNEAGYSFGRPLEVVLEATGRYWQADEQAR